MMLTVLVIQSLSIIRFSAETPAAVRQQQWPPPGVCILSARFVALRVWAEPQGYSEITHNAAASTTVYEEVVKQGCRRRAHQVRQVVLMDHLSSCKHGQHASSHHPQVAGP